MNPPEAESQLFVQEELRRQLAWVKKNIAAGLGGAAMDEQAQRIEDELKKLKEGD